MADVYLNSTFKLKRGTATQWQQLNPILQLGEPGYEKDTHRLKVGDGVKAWNELPYIGGTGGGGGNSGNYEDLSSKPQINGVTLTGNIIIKEDVNYVHNQLAAASTWSFVHNLNKFPAITVVDSGGNEVIGEVEYTSSNQCTIRFSSAFSGKAYLN